MRVVQVLTNETCDLRCSFCDTRRDHERASVAGAAAVLARIEAAAGSAEILLTGGEPTLRRDLTHWVRHARTRAPRVVLQTNARNVDAPLARALVDAGLTAARIHVPAAGAALDRIAGGTDLWPVVIAGAEALRDAGVELEVAVPIVADNAAQVGVIPDALLKAGIVPTRLWIVAPLRSPQPQTLASRATLVHAIEALADVARTHGWATSLDPATFVAPCQLPHPARHAPLYQLNAGAASRSEYAKISPCERCRVADRCPGLPLDAPAFADAIPRPLTDERTRRRLTMIDSPQAQAERELVTHEVYRRPDGSSVPAHVIRINFRCNQACTFCFVSTHLPSVADAQIVGAIEAAATEGAILVLSGGEPTLNPKLADYVTLGKRLGVPEVELQTNAVRLAEPGLASKLSQAGVDIAFVSLHAATAATSDRITGAAGTFQQTVAGLDALAASAIAVRINYVLCRPNADEFPAFIDLVAARWPAAAITVSFVGTSTDLVPRTTELVPRYRDVIPSLTEGLRRAAAHGLVVDGFDSMCGIPLCLVPVDPTRWATLAAPPEGYDRGELIHPPPCEGCGLRRQCFGLRRGYAELYGWDELRPVP